MEQLVQAVCDQKQGYTQFGGLRPYGGFLSDRWLVSILFTWTSAKCEVIIIRDKEFGFQLYQSDPAGNYTAWKVRH